MGASHSKSTVEKITEAITNVSTSVVQKCVVGVTLRQDQTFNFVNTSLTDSTIRQKQASYVKSECFGDTKMEADLQNKLISQIKNVATAGGVGLSMANANTKIKDLVTTNITLKNVHEAYTSLDQSQKTTYNFLNSTVNGVTFDMTQGAQVFAASVLKVAQDTKVINDIAAIVDQSSTAKGVSLADFLPNIGQLLIIGVVVIVVAFAAWKLKTSRGGGGGGFEGFGGGRGFGGGGGF